MSWASAKWATDRVLRRIGQPPNNMRAFSGEKLSNTSLGIKFLEPTDSYVDDVRLCAVKGVMIRMSTVEYPTDTSEGDLVVDNQSLGQYQSTNFTVSNLTAGATYYLSAFPYTEAGAFNLSQNAANRVTITL